MSRFFAINRYIGLFRFISHFETISMLWVPEKWEKGLYLARFVFLTVRRPFASHDSNPYPNRSRIAQCNATKFASEFVFFICREILWEIWQEFCGFLDPQHKGQENQGNIGAFFARNSNSNKHLSCQLRSADMPP